MKHFESVTSQIIQGAYAVHRYFDSGFLEKIYENAVIEEKTPEEGSQEASTEEET